MKHGTTIPGERRERGQTLIEFAFIAPVLLVLLLTIVDFGIAIDRRQVIQHAVREGARQGAVRDLDIAQLVDDQSQDVLDSTDVTVCYDGDIDGDGVNDVAPGSAGSNIRVSATFVYRFSLGASELMAAFGADPDLLSVTMTPHAEARMERSLEGVMECPPLP